MGDQRPPYYQQHAGWYRPILDLQTPFVASPVLDDPKTPGYLYFYAIPATSSKPSHDDIKSMTQPTIEDMSKNGVTRSGKNGVRWAIARLLFRLANMLLGGKIIMINEKSSAPPMVPTYVEKRSTTWEWEDEVPLREWKMWGYYACPKLHGEFVKNYPPARHMPLHVNVQEVFRNLVDADGTFHGERWIPGLQHPAIPPRPKRWKLPPRNVPQPFPWKCQLNPLLQHIAFGLPAVLWDVSFRKEYSRHGQTENLIPLLDPEFAQPATYPFLTHMYIICVAEDPYPEEGWPFFVINDSGITVGDVLDHIYASFHEYLSREEYESWDNREKFRRQRTLEVGFEARRGHRGRHYARRHDTLGTHKMFRGLEPHPNREGWVIFLGPGEETFPSPA